MMYFPMPFKANALLTEALARIEEHICMEQARKMNSHELHAVMDGISRVSFSKVDLDPEKVYVIVCGDQGQFQNFCHNNNLNPRGRGKPKVYYAQDVHSVAGLAWRTTEVVFTGTWWNRPMNLLYDISQRFPWTSPLKWPQDFDRVGEDPTIQQQWKPLQQVFVPKRLS